MIKSVVHADEIALWWQKEWGLSEKADYRLWVDGQEYKCGESTHYIMKNLVAETDYAIRLERVDCKGERVCLDECTLRTSRNRKRIDVTKAPYFAVGDGKTMNTIAIQKAIDDCKANESVYIPQGVFLTGALTIHSDMELYVDEGATLQGSVNISDYLPKIKSRYGGKECECYQSLLNVGRIDRNGDYNVRNVVIRGKGAILGGGKELAVNTIETESGTLFNLREFSSGKNLQVLNAWRSRGRLLQTCNTQNIVIAGVTIGMGASWNLHFIYSKDITTYDCNIVSQGVNNGDGWDPDSSVNCVVFATEFNTYDDCIAIKSGKNPEGNIINKPSENIFVFDCIMNGGHGMAIGSEMSGGVRNVRIWNCDLTKTHNGIEVKATRKRGGYVRDIRVGNCKLSRLEVHSVPYNDDGEGSLIPPIFENFYFEDLEVEGQFFLPSQTVICPAIEIIGFGEDSPVTNVELKNVIAKRQDDATPAFDLRFVKNLQTEKIMVI